MYTRFHTDDGMFLYTAPNIKIPGGVVGAELMSALGGAYEYEEEHLRCRLVDMAYDLRRIITDPRAPHYTPHPDYIAELDRLIAFLESSKCKCVHLYSYERAPTLDELLKAWQAGAGGNDWALEEVDKCGQKARDGLLAVLKKRKAPYDDKLAAIAMLSIVFLDAETDAVIEKCIDSYEDSAAKKAALELYGAYKLARGTRP